MKKLIVRLLLFGIPCAFSYLATRPAPPPPAPAFVVCSVSEPDGGSGREVVLAVDSAHCDQARSSLDVPESRAVIPAHMGPEMPEGLAIEDESIHLSF